MDFDLDAATNNVTFMVHVVLFASATRRMCLFVAVCKDLNPKSQKIGNYKITNGCVRKSPLQCNDVRNSSIPIMHDVLNPMLLSLRQLRMLMNVN